MTELIEEQVDDCHAICPYCKEQWAVEMEDYSEDRRIEECFGCDKKFYLEEQFSVEHVTSPDCELNGEEHVWGDVVGS